MKKLFRKAIFALVAAMIACSFSGCALFPPKYKPTGSGRTCCGY